MIKKFGVMKALDLTVEQWTRMAEDPELDKFNAKASICKENGLLDVHRCFLCQQSGENCKGCPVTIMTGVNCCHHNRYYFSNDREAGLSAALAIRHYYPRCKRSGKPL